MSQINSQLYLNVKDSSEALLLPPAPKYEPIFMNIQQRENQ